MSEEFDKEAEREKLREKLEKDEQKRQETQRMSELLLQGATMTNEHCENCGDPLFRDGDRTFCPTCSGAGAEQAAPEAQQQQREAQQQQPEPAQSQPAPESQAAPKAGERTNGAEPTPQGATEAGVDEQRPPTRRAPEPAADDATTPRAALQRAVTTTARNANEATDPRTAKQWLEAAKEAAEALEALE